MIRPSKEDFVIGMIKRRKKMIRYLVNMMEMVKNEEGQGMVEYALIIGGIAIVALVAMKLIEPELSTLFTNISTEL
jgi:pilus assembly protein Flp/PilA